MILGLLRLLFVLPMRLQRWIERVLLVVGVVLFAWRLWERVKDRMPRGERPPAEPPKLPPAAWDRADDLPDASERPA